MQTLVAVTHSKVSVTQFVVAVTHAVGCAAQIAVAVTHMAVVVMPAELR
jgi:hypothetical protein